MSYLRTQVVLKEKKIVMYIFTWPLVASKGTFFIVQKRVEHTKKVNCELG